MKEISEPTMGGEDVAISSKKCGTFFVHGGCNPGADWPHHSRGPDLDEETFPLGSALFAGFALTPAEIIFRVPPLSGGGTVYFSRNDSALW
ncbi:hypothetical protein MASR1M66_23330 [Aminivibrio sp.]